MSQNIKLINGWLRALLTCVLFLSFHSVASAQVVRYVHTDGLGSVSVLTDTNRNAIERREYEPYGASLNGVVDGVGYAGHVTDASTGLTYMQQRYYDPGLGRFLSVDQISAFTKKDQRFFNRYSYAFNNPYAFTDPDGRCPICLGPVIAGVFVYLTSGPANAPAPGEVTGDMPVGDQISNAIPGGGRALATARMTVRQADRLTQRAATREAKRQVGIPTSQQAQTQSNGRANDGTQVGRQQTFEVPSAGGGTQAKSVQVSRDIRGEHAGMTQVEAGKVKAGGQTDEAGRPRLMNEGKVRVDFDPYRGQ
ncbi:RHS repeat-associated core domain-containing protein [Xanthomonas cannabis]|uniref:RHS repeat-associated core domain-containing protein n=1 Tax=Xanthomonas cannabis TaxID=1885674 RepID=UPI00141B35ED|nr:RHS repeat-associated core domain-containing protein [Xanthomonas cannabis]NIK20758.1 RHS repeat-associated protein [Xanthomonas cannabis]